MTVTIFGEWDFWGVLRGLIYYKARINGLGCVVLGTEGVVPYGLCAIGLYTSVSSWAESAGIPPSPCSVRSAFGFASLHSEWHGGRSRTRSATRSVGISDGLVRNKARSVGLAFSGGRRWRRSRRMRCHTKERIFYTALFLIFRNASSTINGSRCGSVTERLWRY